MSGADQGTNPPKDVVQILLDRARRDFWAGRITRARYLWEKVLGEESSNVEALDCLAYLKKHFKTVRSWASGQDVELPSLPTRLAEHGKQTKDEKRISSQELSWPDPAQGTDPGGTEREEPDTLDGFGRQHTLEIEAMAPDEDDGASSEGSGRGGQPSAEQPFDRPEPTMEMDALLPEDEGDEGDEGDDRAPRVPGEADGPARAAFGRAVFGADVDGGASKEAYSPAGTLSGMGVPDALADMIDGSGEDELAEAEPSGSAGDVPSRGEAPAEAGEAPEAARSLEERPEAEAEVGAPDLDSEAMEDPERGLRIAMDLFEAGEHARSLEICDFIADEIEPNAELEDLVERNHEILESVYVSQLGDLSSVPRVVIGGAQLKSASIDHRTAFLLTRMDGDTTIEEVLDISGMSRMDAAKLILDAVEKGLVEIGA
jgi:hypothetical protein